MPIAHKVEAEWDLGNAKLIPSTIAKDFLRGGLFLDKGDILLQQSNCWRAPGGLIMARNAAVLDLGGSLSI